MARHGEELNSVAVWRLVRCRTTQRYFTGDGWTYDPEEAMAFPDEIDAIRACIEHDLRGVELVLRVPGSRVDLFAGAIR
jgi:hypothetical protein